MSWHRLLMMNARSGLASASVITIIALSTEAVAAVEKIGDTGFYAGVSDNAILILLLTQAVQFVWVMSKWIVDKYFREQKDKDAEVKLLKAEFHGFREEVSGALKEIKNEMRHIAKLPDEDDIMRKLSERMEFMVYKAARDLGIKDNKR